MQKGVSNDRDKAAWRRLLSTNGIGVETARRLVRAMGSPAKVIGATREMLRKSTGLGWSRVDRIIAAIGQQDLEAEERWLASNGGVLLPFGDSMYPGRLVHLPDPPAMLRCMGDPSLLSSPCVAMVGTRRCTAMGLRQTGRFVQGFVEAGCVVVSGGARGIDAEAHRAALRFGGRTVAVLGGGLACPYPLEHEDMFNRITSSGGMVLSEVSVYQEPRPGLFPRRNRIISGLSMAVIIIEAPARSGAMITARIAVEEHGIDAMAVPGPADAWTSSGCHRAVQEGWAHLVTSPEDVLRLLEEDYSTRSLLGE
ncbi:MAG: DNA-protecting protein DprA [Phycisphaerae bacterium]|nr:DNA-protecting protein DprA [Phycisphaerae bacterium]